MKFLNANYINYINYRGWRSRLVLLVAVIGPGFITASGGDDAGGVFTYSQAGAQFGYSLLWTMIPIAIALIVTNFGNVVAEFAGIASSLELFGASRYIVVPASAFILWVVVVRGTYAS